MLFIECFSYLFIYLLKWLSLRLFIYYKASVKSFYLSKVREIVISFNNTS